jgi:iron complex outermembrane receptor protein
MSTSCNLKRSIRWALFSSLAAGASLHAVQASAQTQSESVTDEGRANIETVYVTGSAIRRVQGETSLPVQVIDAEAIQKTGVSSVVDLMQRLPTMQGATGEAASVGAATFGFSGVSLHNVGENRTLVLLNGRRLALFGGQTLTGFAAAMDLNAIPVSAIERVEVLSDGASALYGSDAIAGVVNFITKDKSQDKGVYVNYYAPEDGARENGVNLSAGFGDYEKDGYNVFFTAAAESRDELKSVDRDFASSAIVNFNHEGKRWTFFNGSPRGIPANATTDAGDLVSPYLLANGSCPPQHAQVDQACYYDYVPDIQIYPERKRRTATGAFNVKVGESQNAFVDVLWSRTEQTSKTAPVPGELLVTAGSDVFNTYLAPLTDESGAPLFTADSVVPYRGAELGQRINNDKADFYQVSAGLEGQVANWDYDFALTQSESDVKGSISGYPGALAFNSALSSGLVNPFVGPGQQTPEGQAAISAINYKGYWDGGTSRLRTAELRASRSLFDLPNGHPVQFAAGVSWYDEKFQSKPSDFAQANLDDPVAGIPAAGGPHTGDQRFGDASATIPYGADRNTLGAFTEVRIQPFDILELTGSLRYDNYSDVGDTTNYKVSFKATPVQALMLRGSYGTGFHAPTVPQLNASRQSYGVTASNYDCSAELQAIATGLGAVCRPPETQYDVVAAGNPDLKPEKSDQWSLGFVYEPTRSFSFGADYWNIKIDDAFGQIDEGEAFANPTGYPNGWTTFSDIGTGTTYLALDQSNVNTGKERYSGVDFNIQGNWNLPRGHLRSQLMATYMIESEAQLSATGPFFANVGSYSNELDEVAFRWVGRLLTSYDVGNWSHTLTLNLRSGYRDVETTVDGIDEQGNFNGETADVRLDVSDYLTVDWQSTWNARDWLDVSVGVLNLFNEDPPLSLTAANFQIGYDARYYDPRGRVLFGRATIKF